MFLIHIIFFIGFSFSMLVAKEPNHSQLRNNSQLEIDREIKHCGESLKLVKRGHFKQALGQTSAQQCPLVTNLVVWLALKSDKHPLSFKTYQRFLQENPGWPWASILRKQAEFQMNETISSKEILAWFKEETAKTVKGLLLYVNALESLKRFDKAQTVVRKFWIDTDFKAKDEAKIVNTLSHYLTAAVTKTRATRLLNEGKHEASERLIPYTSSQDQLYIRNRLRLQRKQSNLSFSEIFKDESSKQDPHLVKDYLTWLRQQQNAQAFSYLESVKSLADKFPEKFWKERYILSREALEALDAKKAYKLAANHHLTTGVDYVEAEWFSGWIALQFLNQPKQAFKHFSQIESHVKTAISQSRVCYWLGRTAETLNQPQNAMEFYKKSAKHRHTFLWSASTVEIERSLKKESYF